MPNSFFLDHSVLFCAYLKYFFLFLVDLLCYYCQFPSYLCLVLCVIIFHSDRSVHATLHGGSCALYLSLLFPSDSVLKLTILPLCVFSYSLFLFLRLITVPYCSIFSLISFVFVYLRSVYLSNIFLSFCSRWFHDLLFCMHNITSLLGLRYFAFFLLFVLEVLYWLFCPSFVAVCCSVLLISPVTVSADPSVFFVYLFIYTLKSNTDKYTK